VWQVKHRPKKAWVGEKTNSHRANKVRNKVVDDCSVLYICESKRQEIRLFCVKFRATAVFSLPFYSSPPNIIGRQKLLCTRCWWANGETRNLICLVEVGFHKNVPSSSDLHLFGSK